MRQVWENQPKAPSKPAIALDLKYAGVDVAKKLADVRATFTGKNDVDALIVSALDEVAWLFNIRGADIDFNPVVIAYGVVTRNSATLFVDAAKLDAKVRAHLHTAQVETKPYDSFFAAVTELNKTAQRIWIDGSRANLFLLCKSRRSR